MRDPAQFMWFIFIVGKYGKIEFTLQYDPNTQELLVIVHNCKVVYTFLVYIKRNICHVPEENQYKPK